MSITISDVSRRFGSTTALHPLSLEINQGEMVGLLGPSGSGKTTLLRIIAGLEAPDSGSIHFGNREVTHVHVRKRRVGFVFQHYALFRHMSVFENVAFGLRARPASERPSNAEIRDRVQHLLERVRLDTLAKRLPAQLSGGQQQRVALARALAVEPEVLLLDEPFGALDAKVRLELRRWLRHLHEEFGFTSVFVTHDQEEALELSDRVVVMSNGRIEQIDTPQALYRAPANRFVFSFLGETNRFGGEYHNGRLQQGNAWIALEHSETAPDEVLLRPHELMLTTAPDERAYLPVTVDAVSPVGSDVRVELMADWMDAPWLASITHHDFDRLLPARGDSFYVVPSRWHRFAPETT
ncbi:sulfate/molybdate ABC transporter ATP-binding protein [Kushneria marisflavi]|uniref:Sulfate ABC transporter ATP-binding protein n=1 Tax=Kushneria marisflavi TaxID=157779 RepID=A0A240UT03_9GAMM|nr:TOBE-like domain-containing protein [Kushneria marisflavi]ART64172.1 sulfate ABC transporter ATP-binding protein [Kushneria marisflavi]RKD76625.1 sulfate transport system ATP-binding protein [Kushneria marisflavi]